MSRSVLTPQAAQDLQDIGDFIARANPRRAARWIRTMEKKCQILAQFPDLGSLCEDVAPSLHQFSVGNYVIFYRAVSEGIEVVRILHGARDYPTLFT